jgi:hypothetical protein
MCSTYGFCTAVVVARRRPNNIIRIWPVLFCVTMTLVEMFGPGQKFLDLYYSGDQRSVSQMGETYLEHTQWSIAH